MGKSPGKKEPITKSKANIKNSFNNNLIFAAGLFLFAFLLYANTLGHGFVLDDPLAIELNKNVTSGISGIGDIIKGGYRENNFGGQLYRPISLVQFAIEWTISPNNPSIHHFFNIFWYACSVVLMFLVLRGWFPDKTILLPLIISIIFAAHPLHTEVVANIKSRDEIMSLFFIMTALLTFTQYVNTDRVKWLVTSVCLYFFALMSKESSVTMFPVFGMALWWIFGKSTRQSFLNGLYFLIPVVLMFMIRYSIFGLETSLTTDIMDNPIVSANGWGERLATSLVILWKYFSLHIFPHPLSSDYSYSVIPVVGFSHMIPWISLVVHFYLVVVAISGIKSRKFLSFAIISYLMAISLFSQIPVIIGTMFGERLAYLPSFWFVSGLVYILIKWLKADSKAGSEDLRSAVLSHKVLSASVVIIVSGFSLKTVTRNMDWQDNRSLFIADVATYPGSVRLNNGAADQMLKAAGAEGLSDAEVNDRLSKAEAYCNAIMKIRPVATAYLTLGNIRMRQKKYEESISYYDQVNDLKNIVDINKALAYRELGRQAGEKEQNIAKSHDMLSKSIALNAQDAESWYLMGVSYGVSGNHQKAAENFEKAYQIKPGPEYAKNVIAAYQYLGNQAKIAEYQKYLGSK